MVLQCDREIVAGCDGPLQHKEAVLFGDALLHVKPGAMLIDFQMSSVCRMLREYITSKDIPEDGSSEQSIRAPRRSYWPRPRALHTGHVDAGWPGR